MKILWALTCALLMGAPAMAGQATAPTDDVVYSAPAVDYGPEIRRLENKLTLLSQKKAVSYQKEVAHIEAKLVELRALEAATRASASASAASTEESNSSADRAVAAAEVAVASKDAAALSAQSTADSKKGIAAFMAWLSANLFVAVVALVLVIGVALQVRSLRTLVFREILKLSDRIENIDDRCFSVKVEKVKTEPFRTILPAELKTFPVGRNFFYYIKVDGEIVRYDCGICKATEKGDDVFVACQQITGGVRSRDFFGTLADKIEENGGPHPHTSL